MKKVNICSGSVHDEYMYIYCYIYCRYMYILLWVKDVFMEICSVGFNLKNMRFLFCQCLWLFLQRSKLSTIHIFWRFWYDTNIHKFVFYVCRPKTNIFYVCLFIELFLCCSTEIYRLFKSAVDQCGKVGNWRHMKWQ